MLTRRTASSCHYNFHRHVVNDNWVERLWAVQDSILSRFHDGRPFEPLIQSLQSGAVDPMTASFLVLDAAEANIRLSRDVREKRYYTLDHRRLWCMYQARCPKVQVRIKPQLCGKDFSDFVNKAGVGRRVYELRVRRARE